MAPKFSIITVVKDDVAGAVTTMQSIFAQSLTDYEVIAQDGASGDGTPQALRALGPWIDSFETAPDAGIFEAMNRALARARGDWVLFLNAADTFVDAGVLARLAAALTPEDDILVGQAIRAEDGMVHEYLPREMFWAGSINDHQASAVRRDLAQELGFDTRYRVAGDLDFFLRARARGARDRAVPIPVARKSFSAGASTDFMARFAERVAILVPLFEGDHPVRETLARSLRGHMNQTYAPPKGTLARLDLDALIALEADWRAARAR